MNIGSFAGFLRLILFQSFLAYCWKIKSPVITKWVRRSTNLIYILFTNAGGKLDMLSGFTSIVLCQVFAASKTLKNLQRNVETLVEQISAYSNLGFETFSDTLRQKTIDRYILSCKSVLKSKEKYVTFLFHHLKKWFRKMIAAKKNQQWLLSSCDPVYSLLHNAFAWPKAWDVHTAYYRFRSMESHMQMKTCRLLLPTTVQ